jgi:hypothetical protein
MKTLFKESTGETVKTSGAKVGYKDWNGVALRSHPIQVPAGSSVTLISEASSLNKPLSKVLFNNQTVWVQL